MDIKGSMVALITPMLEDGSIDYPALDQLIEWHIDAKTDAIVAAGTTGESATLKGEEYSNFIKHVVNKVNGRIPVIAGSGTNSTSTTITLTQSAKEAGADASLIVTPYYNKPTQEGLYQHYKTIAEAVDLPIILYNVPGRTACDLLPETVARLAKIKNIIAIKEATGLLERSKDILNLVDPEFVILSGDDPSALELIKSGAKGVISVTANIAPEQMAKMCHAALNQETATADQINATLMPLHTKLFVESNPIPTKWALQIMGKIKPGIRLPLLELNEKYHQEVKQAMQNAGVL
jgi:4-hydroxy-tetrahydrodipicolinate synthase